MPYKLRKAPKRDLYWVVGQDGTKKSKEPIPLERAKAQMRALYASEKGLKGSGWYDDFINYCISPSRPANTEPAQSPKPPPPSTSSNEVIRGIEDDKRQIAINQSSRPYRLTQMLNPAPVAFPASSSRGILPDNALFHIPSEAGNRGQVFSGSPKSRSPKVAPAPVEEELRAQGKHRGGATPDERGRAGEMRERYKVYDPNVPGNYKYRVTLPQDYVHNLNLIVHSNNNNAMGRMIMKYLEEVEANMPEWYKAHYAGKNSVMFQGQEVGIANKNEWTENKADKAPFYQAYLDSLAPAPIKAPTTQGLASLDEQTPSEVDEETREAMRVAQQAEEDEDRQEAIRVAQQAEEEEAPVAPVAPEAPKAPEPPKAEVVVPDWLTEYPDKKKRQIAKKKFYEANPTIKRDNESEDDYATRQAQIQNTEEKKKIAEAEKARIEKRDKEAQYSAKEVEDTWTPEYKEKIKAGYEKLLASVTQYVKELTAIYLEYEDYAEGLLDLIEAYKPNEGGAVVNVDKEDIIATEDEVLRIEKRFAERYYVFADFMGLFKNTLKGHYGDAGIGTEWWDRATRGASVIKKEDKNMVDMANKLAVLMEAKGLEPRKPDKRGKGVKAKPQSISGGNVPDRSSLQQMAKASYKSSPPTMIGNSKLIKSTPGIKFYLNDRTIIVAIRGSQTQDDWLNANVRIPVNQLRTSNRFKQDSQIIREFQRQYPQGEYEYYGVGHSLGGALLDEFLREGLLDRGLSYNPAIQTQDFDNTNSKNERIYYEGDPLYKTLGQMLKNKPEVRKAPEKKWWEKALDYVPGVNNIISQGKALLEGHDLDRFEGGRKSPETLTPKNPVPLFKTQLEKAGIEPSLYLKEAQRRAKEAGYPHRLLGYASDGSHKLAIPDANGRVIAFGKVKYGDHIIYEHMEKHNRVPKGTAQKKQNTFQKSHSKIKGDWKNNPFSPNALALKILW